MASPQLCLRWNNHHPNFISVFKNLLEDEELVDVTLSIDGQKIKAHKLILSACSPYFKLIFAANPCKHPVVILSDMKFIDVKTIIEFMYLGEISITDERLPDILEAAESLQVRGLFDPNKKDRQEPTTKKKKKESTNTNFTQSEMRNQRLESESDSSPTVPNSHPFLDWMSKQSHGNEYNIEYSTPNQRTFPHQVSYEEELNSILQPDQSMDLLSPSSDYSGTPPGPVRRRNTKVQQSENFHLALEAVRTGQLGFCKAAKIYGLNNRTLWLEYKKRGYPLTRSQPVALKLKQASNC